MRSPEIATLRGRRPPEVAPVVFVALMIVLLACPASAAADRLDVPIHLSSRDGEDGPTVAAVVRVSVPDRGRSRRIGTTLIWTGPRIAGRCRLRVSLEARLLIDRDPALEYDQPRRHFFTRSGVRYGASDVVLDDTLRPAGYTRFAIPRALTPDPKRRTTYLLADSAYGRDECIRPERTAGRRVVDKVLRSVVVAAK